MNSKSIKARYIVESYAASKKPGFDAGLISWSNFTKRSRCLSMAIDIVDYESNEIKSRIDTVENAILAWKQESKSVKLPRVPKFLGYWNKLGSLLEGIRDAVDAGNDKKVSQLQGSLQDACINVGSSQRR